MKKLQASASTPPPVDTLLVKGSSPAFSSALNPLPPSSPIPAQPRPSAGQVAIGQPPHIPDHELIRRIGGGSYGDVWLARSALGTYRAVKIIHRHTFDHARPFEREFAGIQKFEPISRSHEGLVDLLQVDRNDAEGYFYYVMELADGEEIQNEKCEMKNEAATNPTACDRQPSISNFEFYILNYRPKTLRSLLRPSHQPLALDPQPTARLPLDECIQIGLALTNALAHLHGHGLVHRDIKPSNIIFVGGEPKLADVGLVAGVDEARSYVGTEGFIPPEGPGSPPADLYSLGIVLYVMSTGKSHQDFPEPLADLAAQPDHARWLEFNAVIHQACCAKVRDRYQTAEKMHADLVLLQRGESVKKHYVWQQRLLVARRIGLAAVAATLTAAGVLLLWQAVEGRTTPRLQSRNEDGTAGTKNPKAAEAYSVGSSGLRRGTPQGFRVALENFSAATEADPKFVAAHARLFETYLMSEDYDVPFIDGKMKKLDELSAKLVNVAPTNAETHAALAIVHFLNEWKWPEAEAEFQQALKADGNCRMALTYYGYFLTRQLRVSDARPVLERARALHPNSPLIAKFLGHCEFAQRHYEKALSSYQQASVLDPNYPSAYYWAGRAYFGLTNYPQGLAELEQHELKQGSDTAWTQECYRSYRAALEQVGPRGFWSNGAILEQEEARARTPYLSYAFAMRYARAGDKQQALARLEKAFAQHDSMENLLMDEVWDEYHREPGFKHILKKVGLDSWQH